MNGPGHTSPSDADEADPMELAPPTLMIVCGAGASRDSIALRRETDSGSVPLREARDDRYRPPLTDELFAPANLERYMTWRGPAKSLAAEVSVDLGHDRGSFEEVLSDRYRASRGSRHHERGFTALRFYLRDLFREATNEWPKQVGGVTNYAWLVSEVESWRRAVKGYVVWATFNYDGLLDTALEDFYQVTFRRDQPELESYIADPGWCLVKLHGSFDWVRRTSVPRDAANTLLAPGEGADYVRCVQDWDAEADPPTELTPYRREYTGPSNDDNVWIPALMAPLAAKSSFECPPSHVAHLKSRLRAVDVIYAIGWRAQERHFLDLLAAMRVNPPDVYALASNESHGRVVADAIGQACGKVTMAGEPERLHGPVRAADAAEGFSARVGMGTFTDTLAGLVGAAGERRKVREAQIRERGS